MFGITHVIGQILSQATASYSPITLLFWNSFAQSVLCTYIGRFASGSGNLICNKRRWSGVWRGRFKALHERSPRRRNLTFLLRIFSEKPVGRFWFRPTLSQSASSLKFRVFKVLSLSRAFNKLREDTEQKRRRRGRKRRNKVWRPGDVRIPCVIINRTPAVWRSEAASETVDEQTKTIKRIEKRTIRGEASSWSTENKRRSIFVPAFVRDAS